MKGADSKAPDLFSNASLLSMLSRSQTSNRSSGVKGVVPPQSTRKKSDKEIPSSSALARKLSPPPSTSRYKEKECTERISNGPNIYVCIKSSDFCSFLCSSLINENSRLNFPSKLARK
jgi:hypothetical protein